MNFIKYRSVSIVVIVFLFATINSFAQPDWKVNPSDFEYTMTLTGVGILPCIETMDSNDIVAAFIGDEVRGVRYFDGRTRGRNYCFMVIFDSLFTGNKVHFKMYDASEDSIYDALQTVNFIENGDLGSVDNPFVFEVEKSLDRLLLEKNSLSIFTALGTEFTSLYLTNTNPDTIDATFNFINDSLGPDNALFEISNNKLKLIKDISQYPLNPLTIHMSGKSALGCSIDQVLKIDLTDKILKNNDQITSPEILIYPNPARDYLHIQSELPYDLIQIIDLLGTIILEEKGKPHLNINVKELPLGYYMVRIIFSNHKTYSHLIYHITN